VGFGQAAKQVGLKVCPSLSPLAARKHEILLLLKAAPGKSRRMAVIRTFQSIGSSENEFPGNLALNVFASLPNVCTGRGVAGAFRLLNYPFFI
jgi:hypothetical protein